jgi:putative ABC transport system ATP-binding protein
VIQLKHLSKSYSQPGRESVILDDLTHEFPAGGISTILGRSGSGKTTLLNVIAGLDTPSAGDVWVDGTRLTALSERDRTLFRRRNMGFVFQFFNLIPTLTVQENVLLPLDLVEMAGQEASSRANAMLEAVGLADRGQEFPDRLSGGEQQRVAIARALAHDPLLVLADEPTGNLDASTGAQILDLLEGLTRQLGKTMIVATHSNEIVARTDHLWCIREGKLESEDEGCEFLG